MVTRKKEPRLLVTSCGFDFNFTQHFLFFPPLQLILCLFLILMAQRGLMISHIEGDPTQVAPLEQHPNFSHCLRSWLNTEGEKTSKRKDPDHHSQLPRFPSVPSEREPSFFYNQMARQGFLTFLKVKRAGWNVCVGVDALLYKLQQYCLCSARVYVTFWRWSLLMGPCSQRPSSPLSLPGKLTFLLQLCCSQLRGAG